MHYYWIAHFALFSLASAACLVHALTNKRHDWMVWHAFILFGLAALGARNVFGA